MVSLLWGYATADTDVTGQHADALNTHAGAMMPTATRRVVGQRLGVGCARSALLVAPGVQLLGDLGEFSYSTSGDLDHEVEAVVLRGADPLAVNGQECSAGRPCESFVSVYQGVIAGQRMQQCGGFEVQFRVGVLAEHRRSRSRQG